MAALSLGTYPRRFQREMLQYGVRAERMGLLHNDQMLRAVRAVQGLNIPRKSPLALDLQDHLARDARVRLAADPADPWIDAETLHSVGDRSAWFEGMGHSPLELPERHAGLVDWLIR